MKRPTPQPSRSRRGFVTAAIWAPAVAAGALLGPSGVEPQKVAARVPEEPPETSGYRLSEHIRTYYELAARY